MFELLATKLFIPPTRPELVPRPHLIQQLNAGLLHKLTLISAPAGFGKTTLASENALTTLINEITSLPGKVVFVLDDYHEVDAQEVDQALTFLLEHLPLQMHLVITTREDPNLPLARLRAR